jgi:hypothetical protein
MSSVDLTFTKPYPKTSDMPAHQDLHRLEQERIIDEDREQAEIYQTLNAMYNTLMRQLEDAITPRDDLRVSYNTLLTYLEELAVAHPNISWQALFSLLSGKFVLGTSIPKRSLTELRQEVLGRKPAGTDIETYGWETQRVKA